MTPKLDPQYASALANPIAFPGGYTIRFWYPDGETTCHDCEKKAAAEREPDDPTPRVDIYWEGPELTCRDCNVALPSEYGDPNQEETA